jgi:hypothetical protein
MCTKPLSPGVYLIAVGKYINIRNIIYIYIYISNRCVLIYRLEICATRMNVTAQENLYFINESNKAYLLKHVSYISS